MSSSLSPRVPQNAPGDFYVVEGRCLKCCLPHDEAPRLLALPEETIESPTCYFKRQPSTPAEVRQAINALYVSEVCALRYGGTDPAIIEALRKRGRAKLCDHAPEANTAETRPCQPPHRSCWLGRVIRRWFGRRPTCRV